MSQGVTVLGSTGSIGGSTLDVIARNSDQFHVVGLAAQQSIDKLLEQIKRFCPSYVAIGDAHAKLLSERVRSLPSSPKVCAGSEGMIELASLEQADIVVAGIVGAAGLLPTLEATRRGKRVLIANKEALVMSGPLLMDTASQCSATLLPVDSEHNAIFQCMSQMRSTACASQGVTKVFLTGSGGPLLNTPLDALDYVTPDMACAHPNWEMGRKISVDSATMMNKGLEYIEAGILFGLGEEKIDVVVHPQSIIHSMVAYRDGSIIAQLGYPDMRTPIAHALGWPERIVSGAPLLDLTQTADLHFQVPDFVRFPCLKIAIDVMRTGKSLPASLNAANEVAVHEFLAGRIRYTDIYRVIMSVMDLVEPIDLDSVETIMEVDRQARQLAAGCIRKLSGAV